MDIVAGQIVLGGLVVLSHLNPWLVQGHFVLSMVLVGNAMVLRHRAGRPGGNRSHPTVTPALARWGWAVVGLAVVGLFALFSPWHIAPGMPEEPKRPPAS